MGDHFTDEYHHAHFPARASFHLPMSCRGGTHQPNREYFLTGPRPVRRCVAEYPRHAVPAGHLDSAGGSSSASQPPAHPVTSAAPSISLGIGRRNRSE